MARYVSGSSVGVGSGVGSCVGVGSGVGCSVGVSLGVGSGVGSSVGDGLGLGHFLSLFSLHFGSWVVRACTTERLERSDKARAVSPPGQLPVQEKLPSAS